MKSTRLEDFARRRLAGEPVARILGRKEFWGLPLKLSAATLVPRPDTETVVELALEMLRGAMRAGSPLRIADIGTGSGAILLALLSELPDAYGVGTDISRAALRTAQQQCRRSRARRSRAASSPATMPRRCPAVRSDRVESALYPLGRNRRPRNRGARSRSARALDGGADGLDAYRALIPQAARLLAPGGALVVEVGQGQSGDIERLMTAAGLTLRGAGESRSGGYPAGRRGPKIAPIKPDWNAKNHLEYSPGATTFRSQHRSRVAGPVDATGGGQSSQSESPPRVKGSKTQVQSSAMALESCAASDRKANESLILRLKTHARNLCLFWQAE